jgi:hypothetical protein
MKYPLLARVNSLGMAIVLTALAASSAIASDLKFEAQLLWGTNDAKSPDPRHKPISDEIRNALKDLPLKWTNYFEVSRATFSVGNEASKKVTLSDKCDLEVKNIGKSRIEVYLFGKGEPVWKRNQPLPKGETLVLGGNAPNSTAWLVTLKRLE